MGKSELLHAFFLAGLEEDLRRYVVLLGFAKLDGIPRAEVDAEWRRGARVASSTAAVSRAA